MGPDFVSGCTIGEFYSNGLCLNCPENTYTLGYNQTVCKKCPAGANCLGGWKMESLKGYWRANDRSDTFVECYNRALNCVGGSSNFTCGKGHIGALCESCDTHEK